MKKLSILGSTGSIGRQTLELVRADRDLRAVGLAALKNIDLIFEQIREFHPETVCIYEREKAEELKCRLAEAGITETEVVSGMEGLEKTASLPSADQTVLAVVGMIGILPAIAAIRAGKDLALANKETLVAAGHIIMPLVREYGISLMPVDSEHSAICQCLEGERKEDLDRILLTASGGPFRGYTAEQLSKVTPADALKHPNWNMGAKITVDCATMVNKALEVMEAHWLFDVPVERIQVVIQPKSIVHSMVQFIDGAVKAQLGVPSMLIPIEYAIYQKKRHILPKEQKLDFTRPFSVDFDVPDSRVFRGLQLGIEAGTTGGSMPAVFNAANEEAVALFLEGRLPFPGIADAIETAMRSHISVPQPSLDEIFHAEQEARKTVRSLC